MLNKVCAYILYEKRKNVNKLTEKSTHLWRKIARAIMHLNVEKCSGFSRSIQTVK